MPMYLVVHSLLPRSGDLVIPDLRTPRSNVMLAPRGSWHRPILRAGLGALCNLVLLTNVAAGVSMEESNGCAGTQTDPCTRTGTCEIQGASWSQVVTIDRADIFDTQGWAGVCDMVHVALVQGRCEPAGAQVNVVAFLSETTSAAIPEIVGPLSCEAEAEPLPVPMMGISASAVLVTSLGVWGAHSLRRRRWGTFF